MNVITAKGFNLKSTLESGRVFRYHYNNSTGFYCVVAGFARAHFGEYAGYAQQFLYHSHRAGKYSK